MGPLNLTPSIDTKILADHLSEMKVGDSVRFSDLCKLVGHTRIYGFLATARKQLLNEKRMVFQLRMHVLRRLSDNEIIDVGSSSIRKIRRESKRGIKKLASVDYEKLDENKKLKQTTSITVLVMTAASTGIDSVKRIEQKVSDAKAILPAAKAALAFIGDIDAPKEKK